MSNQQLLNRFERTNGDSFSVIFNWIKQGIIRDTKQFKALFGRIVEQEVHEITADVGEGPEDYE